MRDASQCRGLVYHRCVASTALQMSALILLVAAKLCNVDAEKGRFRLQRMQDSKSLYGTPVLAKS